MVLPIGDNEDGPLLKPLHSSGGEQRYRNFLHRLGLTSIFALMWVSVTQAEPAQALQKTVLHHLFRPCHHGAAPTCFERLP
ncbi:hypothetical protein PC129_g18606 [Phytophthora cactorum]|uniref:Uncharacterized protein n=1 Tax=Phytophthora cactorum TaxID=29920 RepID=A0A8T1FJ62_9STRA|nr:hypothetical protein Pcac1_g22766 [Phytophthora cactorum]KAG2805421.1 hypothetical protein PC111_g17818 [Phytophthora cactorum]KAG2819591.1 hypothetical protein PC112_g12131 [Phytophthora cactorum]KAG2846876.1 hypothetical protein PC113_g17887 [Phytophthora cactorum]KAG2881347.1 hypothetical protein PC114_g21610 [Phytophthora cactorum]